MNSRNSWEHFIIIAIILAIIQTFLDEYSRYEHWSVVARNVLMFAGLFFDFLFSAEFTVRVILAAKKNGVSGYWKHQRGWIDFLSSFPLLLLDLSSAYLLLSGHLQEGAFSIVLYNALKFIEDMRLTRILRFVRIIKIFWKVPNAESAMVKHHTAAISTTAAFAIICTLSVFSMFGSPIDHKIFERTQFFDESISTIKYLETKSGISYKDIVKKIFSDEKNLLKLIYKDEVVLSRISDEKFEKYYDHGDYALVNNRGFILYFSVVDLNRELAYKNITNFFMIIFTVLSLMLFYKRHFSQTVGDVINIINKGFRSRNYNEQVKIRGEYEQDEVFKLAKFYNDVYLPAKLKRITEENKTYR